MSLNLSTCNCIVDLVSFLLRTLIYCTSIFYLHFIFMFTGGSLITTLNQFLNFFTGASEIPPTGFDTHFTLRFSDEIEFPTAVTCSLSLTLPTKYFNDHEVFKERFTFALLNHGGFGLC